MQNKKQLKEENQRFSMETIEFYCYFALYWIETNNIDLAIKHIEVLLNIKRDIHSTQFTTKIQEM